MLRSGGGDHGHGQADREQVLGRAEQGAGEAGALGQEDPGLGAGPGAGPGAGRAEHGTEGAGPAGVVVDGRADRRAGACCCSTFGCVLLVSRAGGQKSG